MKTAIYNIVFTVLAAFPPTIVPAQTLPVLPTDSRITTGRLENGISYYIVESAVDGNLVDISLVQKAGFASETVKDKGISEVHSRGALADLPRFGRRSPLEYLVSKSVWPSREGYASVHDDATIFRFERVPVTSSLEAVDSTLLMTFEVISSAPGAALGRYAPGNQAVIVVGNINTSTIIGKLEMLSMLVQKRPAPAAESYLWEPFLKPHISITESSGGLSSIEMKWFSPRTPADKMSTVLPIVTKLLCDEMGALIEKRLAEAFREKGLPVAGFGATYIDSGLTGDDESFSVRVTVLDKDIKAATGLLIETLSTLDAEGVDIPEYKDVRQRVLARYVDKSGDELVTNNELTEACIKAFMYGRPLASRASRFSFVAARRMDPVQGTKLFNNFMQALLDGYKNLSVKLDAPKGSFTSEELQSMLDDAWAIDREIKFKPVTAAGADTTSMNFLKNSRVKVAQIDDEPMTGGRIITLSNGIRVIYHRDSTMNNILRFSLLFKGGYSQIPGLQPIHGPYVGDMLLLGNIGSMPGYRFREMLSSNAVTFDVSVSPNEFRIGGHLPTSKLALLLKSLSAVVAERSVDKKQYDYYRENLRLARMLPTDPSVERAWRIDSILCPKGLYSLTKRRVKLPDDLPAKAESFFSKSFEGIRDAVWVINGDISEEALCKVLTSNLGRFKTASGSVVPRFRGSSQYLSGKSKVALPAASEPSVDMGFTTPSVILSLQNFIASGVAAELMRDAVAKAIAPLGWFCQADWNIRMYPEDRLSVQLQLSPAGFQGLPASMIRENSVDRVISKASQALEALKTPESISNEELAKAKSSSLNACLVWENDSESFTRLLELRYMYGMDFLSGAAAKAEALTKAKIVALISKLLSGGQALVVVPAIPEPELKPEETPEPELPAVGSPSEVSDSTGLLNLYRRYILGIIPPADTLRTQPADSLRPVSLDSIRVMLRDSTVIEH